MASTFASIGALSREFVRSLWNSQIPKTAQNIVSWEERGDLKKFYEENGYKYIIPVGSCNLVELHEVEVWCNKFIKNKWTRHWHKVQYSADGLVRDEYTGFDHIVFAFECDKDATIFALRWGGKING